jgi:hypothetical protein
MMISTDFVFWIQKSNFFCKESGFASAAPETIRTRFWGPEWHGIKQVAENEAIEYQ